MLQRTRTTRLPRRGSLLDALRRPYEGMCLKQRALELDSQSPAVFVEIATSYWHQRRYDEAIEWADKALVLDPRHCSPPSFSSVRAGSLARSIACSRKAFDAPRSLAYRTRVSSDSVVDATLRGTPSCATGLLASPGICWRTCRRGTADRCGFNPPSSTGRLANWTRRSIIWIARCTLGTLSSFTWRSRTVGQPARRSAICRPAEADVAAGGEIAARCRLRENVID